MKDQLSDVDVMVAKFDIDDSIVIDRLSNRYVCKNKSCQRVYSLKANSVLSPKVDKTCDSCGTEIVRRKDDIPEAIKERLKVYRVHADGLLTQFNKAGYKIHELQCDIPAEELFAEFREKMEA